ncbi:glutamylcysteine synthetase [Ruminococcus flavefaciens]|uniref:glutamate--cysteine ligase n=1 Tax=Ruminococcus flavefaciens TaxID=1265 RepID=A0A1M7LNJ7_RUMFL|nr:glutamylcysteine synthetase [Ruminococcus flavefaciens]SHM79590.1 Gamma-glutamylcysteine synthetase [Ruminococcus flavefaciens]
MNENIRKAIYDKYIAPTKKERPDYIGVEIEMPVVNLSGQPVDEAVSIETAESFIRHFGFIEAGRGADGNITSAKHEPTGDILSFDCCYSNLELSFGKAADLFEIKSRFEKYCRFLNAEFSKHGYTLTGMGVNPNADINHNQPIQNERYRMLYHYLHSYPLHKNEVAMRFHERPDFGTFTSASQVQLDVRYDELTDVINVFGLLEPYKALLFANSYLPDYPDFLCVRNMLWEHSMQGYNPHNVGMFGKKVSSIDELIDYIGTQSIYCTMRDGKYIDFTPLTLDEFFSRKAVEGEYFDGEKYQKITFAPDISDLEYLRTFKFEDLTFRGTIEYRSSCCQPLSESLTVAAFHTGLKEKLYELKEILENDNVIYSHGFNALELQKLLSKRSQPYFIDENSIEKQLIRILDLSAEGLKQRDLGEEILLAPLYERAQGHTNPARTMLEGIKKCIPMINYIKQYAAI